MPTSLCAPNHRHFQTKKVALSLPCNRTWGDASESMRKRRQGMFKKSFHSAMRHLRPRRRKGLQDVPHIIPPCVWAPDVHGYYAEDPFSQVIKCPFPPTQRSHFFTLESPALPKAQASKTKTQVMITPRISTFRHRLPASYQCKTLGVWFSLQ